MYTELYSLGLCVCNTVQLIQSLHSSWSPFTSISVMCSTNPVMAWNRKTYVKKNVCKMYPAQGTTEQTLANKLVCIGKTFFYWAVRVNRTSCRVWHQRWSRSCQMPIQIHPSLFGYGISFSTVKGTAKIFLNYTRPWYWVWVYEISNMVKLLGGLLAKSFFIKIKGIVFYSPHLLPTPTSIHSSERIRED